MAKKRARQRKPKVEVVSNGTEIFIVADGVKIAKRGHPESAQAKT